MTSYGEIVLYDYVLAFYSGPSKARDQDVNGATWPIWWMNGKETVQQVLMLSSSGRTIRMPQSIFLAVVFKSMPW